MNAVFGCQGLFNHDRQRGNVGALCLVPLLPEASPSLRSGAEEEDVTRCINKLSSVCQCVMRSACTTSYTTACLSQNDVQ